MYKYNNIENQRREKGTGKDKEKEVRLDKEFDAVNSNSKTQFFDNQIEVAWISTKNAAAILGITPNALRIRKHRGHIQYRYFGKYLRFNAKYLSTLFRSERSEGKE